MVNVWYPGLGIFLWASQTNCHFQNSCHCYSCQVDKMIFLVHDYYHQDTGRVRCLSEQSSYQTSSPLSSNVRGIWHLVYVATCMNIIWDRVVFMFSGGFVLGIKCFDRCVRFLFLDSKQNNKMGGSFWIWSPSTCMFLVTPDNHWWHWYRSILYTILQWKFVQFSVFTLVLYNDLKAMANLVIYPGMILEYNAWLYNSTSRISNSI